MERKFTLYRALDMLVMILVLIPFHISATIFANLWYLRCRDLSVGGCSPLARSYCPNFFI